MKYFIKIESLTPDDIRKFLSKRNPDEYSYVDVRQPGEYLLGHLPGAQLIPLDELPERGGEINPGKTIIVYCSSGIRSRAAVSLLKRAGIPKVHDIEGGIHAWQGMAAERNPAGGITRVNTAHSTEELIGLVWTLEDGVRNFYREMAIGRGRDKDARIFSELTAAEKHHKDALLKLYQELTGREAGMEFPDDVLNRPQEGKLMEGGMLLDDVLSWARGKETLKILELAMSLEISAYDRFIALRDAFENETARQVFGLLAAEERSHLERLGVEFRTCRELRPG
jgi:sulfur-carrier protein adenylyltransferase/sulfurtransferase